MDILDGLEWTEPSFFAGHPGAIQGTTGDTGDSAALRTQSAQLEYRLLQVLKDLGFGRLSPPDPAIGSHLATDPLHENVSASLVSKRKVDLRHGDAGVFGDVYHALRLNDIQTSAVFHTEVFGQHEDTAFALAKPPHEIDA